MKDLVGGLNAWADVVEKKGTEDEQKAAAERVQATVDHLEKLKTSPEEREKLYTENDKDLTAATDRLRKGVEALQKEMKPTVVPNYAWQKKKPKT